MPRPVLSFAKLEEIVANLDDGRLAQAYQDPASVIPGVEIPQSLTNTEMKGRNQVRQAIEAMSQPTDTVADRNYGEFTGQGQQQQQGQGQPQPGQGMPQQQMAYGGLIGYQAGGDVVDPAWRKGLRFMTGAGSMQEFKENPFSTIGQTLMWGLPIGGLGLKAVTKGIPALMSGRAAMGLVKGAPGIGGWRNRLGHFLAGGRGRLTSRGELGRVRAKPGFSQRTRGPSVKRSPYEKGTKVPRYNPKTKKFEMTSVGGRKRGAHTPYERWTPEQIGRSSMLRAGIPAVGIGSLIASGMGADEWGDPEVEGMEGMTREEMIAALGLDPSGGAGGGGGGGGSGGGALYDDMNKVASDRMRQYMRHEDWLRAETPEEAAVRDLQIQMADRLEGRIDPDRDRSDALSAMAARAAQSITAEGRGRGGGADVMAEAALEQIGIGKEQRAAREDLEDQAFRFRAMGPEQAALRSRQSTVGEIDRVMSELQGDLGQLAQVDLSTARQLEGMLQSARMQIEQGQMFGPGEFENMLMLAERAADDPEIPAVTQQRLANLVNMYYGMMEQRLAREYAGQGQDLTTRYTR